MRAVASGTVVTVVDGVPSNTVIGQFPASVIDGAGNHYFIQHGDVVVLYAHMQAGSLNPALAHVGATVKAGDQLGLAGNSGNSTNPHTHIHAQKTNSSGPLRMLEFRDMWVLPPSKLSPPDPAGPWVLVKDQGVPKDSVNIWTAASKPAWYPPSWAEIAYFGIPIGSYQTLFDHVTSSGYRPVWFAGFQAGGNTLVNVIFRPQDGVSWSARHGLTADQYQQEFDAHKKAGKRLLNVNNYIENGHILYAGIWVDTPTPGLQAYHGKNAAEHQALFDQLFKQGFMPINVSVVSQNGNRTYAAFYEKVDTGSLILKSFLTPAEYQQEWNDNHAAGRQLAYLVAYNHSDGPRFSAIFQQKVAGTGGTVGHHGLTPARCRRTTIRISLPACSPAALPATSRTVTPPMPPPGAKLPPALWPLPAASANRPKSGTGLEIPVPRNFDACPFRDVRKTSPNSLSPFSGLLPSGITVISDAL